MRMLIVALMTLTLVGGEVAPVAGVDPSRDELALLLLLNQHRSTPSRSTMWVGELRKAKQVECDDRTWACFHQGGSAPPLVLNPILCAVARDLLKQDVKPPEKAIYDVLPAMRAAGYGNSAKAMTMFATDAPDIPLAYARTLVRIIRERDAGGFPLATMAMEDVVLPDWREVGVAVGGKDRLNAVIVLGQGTAKSHLGGAVYADADRDLVHDPGEGRAGITVSCGTVSMTTGASGAWWLAVNDAAAEVSFAGGGFRTTRPVAQAANAIIDWRLPDPADLKAADRLIGEATKAAKLGDVEKMRVPLAALLAGTRMSALDDARLQRIEELVAPIRGDFDSALDRIMAMLGDEPAEAKKKLADIQRAWKGAMPAWFKEADALIRMRQQVYAVLAAPEEQQAKLAQPVLRGLAKGQLDSTEPRFMAQYAQWQQQLPAEAATEKPKKR